jgi:hypothetical protein
MGGKGLIYWKAFKHISTIFAVRDKNVGIPISSFLVLSNSIALYSIALRYYHVIFKQRGAERVGSAEMEQFYKGHRIEVSVGLDGDSWLASLFIYYSKGPLNILETFAMPDTFKTYDGAIEAGLTAAQKWIDSGKQAS